MLFKTGHYLQLIVTALLLVFLFALPASAQKSGKKGKKQKQEKVECPEPDPVANKMKPDHHNRPMEQPRFFAVDYSGVNKLHGIDVSHYQGRINWDEVARDPNAGYVYLKATEGTTIVDNTYKHNFNECKRVGLKVGSYLFFRPQHSAQAQFELFRKTVATRQQDLLPMVDVEVIKGVSIAVFQARLLELCDLLEREYGVKPLIYTGQNFYNEYFFGNSRFYSYKYFMARYSEEPPALNGNQDFVLWQYTPRGSVKGIRGYVDMSHLVGRHTLNDILYKK